MKDTWLNRIIDWLGWGPCVGFFSLHSSFFSFHSVRLQWNEQSECKRERKWKRKRRGMEGKRVVLCFAFSLCVLCSFKLNTRSFVSACFNLKQRTQRKDKGQIQTIRLLMNEREQKTKLKWKGKWNARRSFSFVPFIRVLFSCFFVSFKACTSFSSFFPFTFKRNKGTKQRTTQRL